jgi:hypothetical protein
MTKQTVPDDTVEAMRHAQATVILSALDDFLRAAPGREIRIRRDEDGVRVALLEAHTSRGESLRDAAAQATTVLLVEAER